MKAMAILVASAAASMFGGSAYALDLKGSRLSDNVYQAYTFNVFSVDGQVVAAGFDGASPASGTEVTVQSSQVFQNGNTTFTSSTVTSPVTGGSSNNGAASGTGGNTSTGSDKNWGANGDGWDDASNGGGAASGAGGLGGGGASHLEEDY